MRRVTLCLCTFLLAAMAGAQTVNLHGIVSNKAGKPIAGATVTLVGLGLKSTTGADGSYSITTTSSVLPSQTDLAQDFTMNNGILELTVRSAGSVAVEVYDVPGHLLKRDAIQNPASGIYRWNIAENARASGLLVVKASIGGQVTILHYLPLGNGKGLTSVSSSTSSLVGSGLARVAAVVDTLKAAASGYVTNSTVVSAYEATQNITLDSTVANIGPSSGCGKALGSLKTGYYTITSGGTSRDYAIDIPTSYSPTHPYRLIYCSHWIYATDKDIVNGTVTDGGADNWAFYGLKKMADSAKDPAIFIAPTALNGMWGEVDHALFDNLLSYAKTNLCIDTTRVFATGFSFGAMMTYSLSTNHQSQLRAVATIAAANYNIWLPTYVHKPIAYLGMTGMSDPRCPFINSASAKTGGLFCALNHAADNGCTVPTTVTASSPGINTTTVGSKSHLIYDFPNCEKGYPVRYITFDGNHQAAPHDAAAGSDDGAKTWCSRETWKFFTQF